MTRDLCWRVRPGAQLEWKHWDDESVVFNALTGDTHLLDLTAAAGLACLEAQARSLEQLVAALAQKLEVEADAQLHEYTRRLVGHLQQLGLIEAIRS